MTSPNLDFRSLLLGDASERDQLLVLRDVVRAAANATTPPIDPTHLIADVLAEELLLEDPLYVAELIVARLRDSGFQIWPTESPLPPRSP